MKKQLRTCKRRWRGPGMHDTSSMLYEVWFLRHSRKHSQKQSVSKVLMLMRFSIPDWIRKKNIPVVFINRETQRANKMVLIVVWSSWPSNMSKQLFWFGSSITLIRYTHDMPFSNPPIVWGSGIRIMYPNRPQRSFRNSSGNKTKRPSFWLGLHIPQTNWRIY